MKSITLNNPTYIEFSLTNFKSLGKFKKLFESIKKTVEKEEQAMLDKRKERQEKTQSFNLMKFFFTSPDSI
jgi:hypothetical protein